MAGWHHWLNGCESEWTLGVGDEQGDLACCDSWGRKESDTTEWLSWTELRHYWLWWLFFNSCNIGPGNMMLGNLALKKALIQEDHFSASFSKLSNSKPHYFFAMISSNVKSVLFWEDNATLKNSFYGTISFQLFLLFFFLFSIAPRQCVNNSTHAPCLFKRDRVVTHMICAREWRISF